MPRLRDNTHPMTRLLQSYHLNGESLSRVLRCSPPTARKKIEDPGRLTMDELAQIHRKVGIPVEDIRRCVC